MKRIPLHSIDDVISFLDFIISDCIEKEDPGGYFAALYQRVTIRVKEGIETNYFDDGERMEKLDVVFAQRYIDAWLAWQNGEQVTFSWEKAFRLARENRAVVLQHLLAGMNAHINLDLGIAAALILNGKPAGDLEDDFFRINQILSSMVEEVQHNLSAIWPPLRKILEKLGTWDNFLVDFSMELARDGAWEFAGQLNRFSPGEWDASIRSRDRKVAPKLDLIMHPGFFAAMVFGIIRWGERGSVADKIKRLMIKREKS